MPDFTFYIDQTDRESMLNALFDERKFKIIPNINHLSPNPEAYEQINPKLLHCLNMNPRCYISGPFSTNSIQTVKMENGAYAGTYIVSENKGGPLLVLSLVAGQIEDGCEYIAPSHLTYAVKFWDEHSMKLIPPSEDLKDAFKLIRGILMGKCNKLNEPCLMWVGHSAKKKFDAGKTALLVNGKRLLMETRSGATA